MAQCSLCEDNTNFFLSRRTQDGRICKKCQSFLPQGIQIRHTESVYLKVLRDKGMERAEGFTATSYYGTMFLDGVHNRLCFSRYQRNGMPTTLGDVYSIREIKEIGLFCTNVQAKTIQNSNGTSQKRVSCDIRAKITTEDTSKEYVLVRNEPCSSRLSEKRTVEWTEPEKLTLFRNLLHQMVDSALFDVAEKLTEIRSLEKQKYQMPKAWARGVLYLPEGYTAEDVKRNRNLLIKALHPDSFPDNDGSFAEAINQAYELLR